MIGILFSRISLRVFPLCHLVSINYHLPRSTMSQSSSCLHLLSLILRSMSRSWTLRVRVSMNFQRGYWVYVGVKNFLILYWLTYYCTFYMCWILIRLSLRAEKIIVQNIRVFLTIYNSSYLPVHGFFFFFFSSHTIHFKIRRQNQSYAHKRT